MSTAPSTSIDPYLLAAEPNVSFTSILTVGDTVGTKADGVTPWRMVGIPDGLGAFDNGDGTITVVMNHELDSAQGVARDHGGIGSFQSVLTIDKATLGVVGAHDAIQHVNIWDAATSSFVSGTNVAISRFCSGDLASPAAYFDTTTGLGTSARIMLAGEENGPEGRAFATVVTGADAGEAYELAYLGNFSWENSVASPFAQAKTIVLGTDDASPGQVYVYIGEKQATGNTVEKAGLVGGDLYGIKVSGITAEANGTIANGSFTLQQMGNDGDVSGMTGAQLNDESNAEGVTTFLRPEDISWDPTDPNSFYFTTTNSFSGPSRVYHATFTDISNPQAGGTITAVLDGTEGQKMLDNLTVGADGKLILQEDVGNNEHLGRVFQYDPATDTLTVIAQHDPALFSTGAANFKTTDEESSGVIDVTSLLGSGNDKTYLLDVQSHMGLADPELVQDGQLLAMKIATPVTNGTNHADTLFGSQADETFKGLAGADSIRAGSGADKVTAGSGNDLVDAGAGNDTVDGGSGIDTILGGAGDDDIKAGMGHDLITGGAGRDLLSGDVGADRFIFTALGDSTVGSEDLIRDFSHRQHDLIDLSAIDANSSTDGNQAFVLVGQFHNVAGELAVSRAGAGQPWLVQGDTNGDGAADFSLMVQSGTHLVAGDFLL